MLIIYLIVNRTIFITAGFVKFSTLGHLKTIAQLSPIRVIIITITILSLGGLPPLTGFMIKFIALYSLVGKSFILLSSLLVLGSLLRLFFYLRISFKASMILFPQHIIRLVSWRKASFVNTNKARTWLISLLFVLRTIRIPLVLFLQISL